MKLNMRNMMTLASITATIAMMACYLDIYPVLQQVKKTAVDERKWHQQVMEEKKWLHQAPAITQQLHQLNEVIAPFLRANNPTIVTAELLSSIMRSAELSGVMIQTLQPIAWHQLYGANALIIAVSAQAHFSQFADFMASLSQSALPILLQDFSLHAEQNGSVKINFQLAGMYVPTTQFVPRYFPEKVRREIKKSGLDPFLPNVNKLELTNRYDDDDLLLHSVPLINVKWVGYIKQNNRSWALAMLPNNKTLAIARGASVGLEQAKLTLLNAESVLLENQGRKIRMSYAVRN